MNGQQLNDEPGRPKQPSGSGLYDVGMKIFFGALIVELVLAAVMSVQRQDFSAMTTLSLMFIVGFVGLAGLILAIIGRASH